MKNPFRRQRAAAPVAVAAPVHELLKVSSEGDTLVAEWHPDATGEVEAARTAFDTIIAQGYFGYTGSGSESRQVKVFDPAAERIAVIPPMAGG